MLNEIAQIYSDTDAGYHQTLRRLGFSKVLVREHTILGWVAYSSEASDVQASD